MNVELLFPGKYLKSADFGGRPVTLTIVAVAREKLIRKDNSFEVKGAVSFKETEKKWILNRTNAEAICAMWGRETDNWIGKRITLFPAQYEDRTAIRVKGSPDIEGPIEATIQLMGQGGVRRSPFTLILEKTQPRRVIKGTPREIQPVVAARPAQLVKIEEPAKDGDEEEIFGMG